jgi:FtsH-binding integral membrane protein
MDSIILTIHSLNRWLIVIVGVLAAGKFLIGWLGNREYQSMDRALMSGYTGLLDLQLLLGIILLITRGVVRYQIEHAITMVIAVVLAHLARLWRDKEDKTKFRNNFIVITVGLILIAVGVLTLPVGWTFSIGG